MRSWSKLLLGMLLMASISHAAHSQQSGTVTLRAVTAFAQNNDLEKGFWLFVEKVQALSGGTVQIEYLGGPEAIPPFEQIEAVRSGVVDLSTNAGSYFSSAIPEGDAMKLSELAPWDERDNGAHAFFADVLAEHGVHYIGRYNTPGLHFNFYTKERVETLEDLRGLRMRISPLYKPFAEALGIVPVQLAHSEIYTALERGMVDGIGAANIGMSQQGHQKFLGFIVEPQFYGNDQVIIMNLEAWNDLPQAAQDAITRAIIETERESSEAFGAIASKERQTVVEEGLEVVMIPDAEQYLGLAREQGWADLVARAPETGPRLRELLTRE